MPYRIFAWILVVLTACDLVRQTTNFDEALRSATSLRRVVLRQDLKLSQNFCKNPPLALRWQWREDGIWTDVCSTFTGYSNLPRYWKLELAYKYELLFAWEIPITVTIVILA
jgi:hypothetical protein